MTRARRGAPARDEVSRIDDDIRPLTEGDVPQLARLLTLAFGGDADEEATLRYVRAGLPYARGRVVDGRLLSSLQMYPFDAYVAGRRVRVGGLAAVASAPEARRRGGVRALLADGLERLHRGGVGWCLEYPFDPTFYARFGFQSVPAGVTLDLPARRLFHGAPPSARPIAADERDGVKPLHAAHARRFHFALARDDGARDAWGRVWQRADGGDRLAYRVDDGYVVFSLDRRLDDKGTERVRLDVRDLAYVSAAGRSNVLGFLGGFEGQVDEVRLHLPHEDPLVADWAAWHGGRGPLLQARVADLPAALAPFASAAVGDLVVGVRDALCAWNDGTWHLHSGPDGTAAERTTAGAQIELDVRELARLLAGGVGAAALLAHGGAVGDAGALRDLARLSGGRRTFVCGADHF